MEPIRRRLATPVDAAGLVWFRAAFGAMVAWEMWRHASLGWVERYWIEPQIVFPYWPFTFVRPWPEPWMTWAHVGVVTLAAIAVTVGLRYRIATWLLFVGFAWLFLVDQTRYLNHFYLISLLAFILTWLPLNREASVDALSGRVAASSTVPAWSLYWLRFMVGLPYAYAGLAKIGPDWLAGYPMRDWLTAVRVPIVQPLLRTEAAVAFFTWGGLLFDLLIVPVILWPRTRVVGLGLMLSFHLMNSRLFKIGIFPWMMILLTLVFLPPDWPRRVWSDIREGKPPAIALAIGAVVGCWLGVVLPVQPSPVNWVVGAIGMAVFFWEIACYGWDHDRRVSPAASVPMSAVGFAGIVAFVVVQLLVPLRHFLIPGDVHWTEEGHRWSWHMKLRDKNVEDFRFEVAPPGEEEPYEVDPRKFLLKHQYAKVAANPEMTVLFGQWLAERSGIPGVAVRVRGRILLNGRPRGQPMIDPYQDLTRVEVPWWPPAPWILPLREPLPVRDPMRAQLGAGDSED